MVSLTIFALIVCVYCELFFIETSGILLQVSALFRHGNRLPDKGSIYPNAPYNLTTFYPYNYGDLTLKGQKTEYEKGEEFRRRYHTFLGEIYHTNLVQSLSSSYIRCQMSMQAFHTGLFGGAKIEQIWYFPWQAIPYSIIPPETDNMISVQINCPALIHDSEYPNGTVDLDTELVFQTIRKYSGFPDPINYMEAANIYEFLKTTSDFGLKIPSKFARIYPEPLRKVYLHNWHLLAKHFNTLIGPLLRRITDNALAKANNTLVPANRKMFLYAGHDLDIYLLLHVLKLFPSNEEINYGASIAFEMHNIDGIYGFKVYLQNNYVKPRLLHIPECGTFCSLHWFSKLADYLIRNPINCSDNV